ncbi:MAG: hypothetical protein M3131_08045 [Actinomycetota bacterium]|nr:hypothetical protein [Actinomycetota bacterium]
MGRRSRKRHSGTRSRASGKGASRSSGPDAPRRERARSKRLSERPPPAPRTRRTAIDDRPPPLWGSFPLTELVTLAGIVLMTWGFVAGPGGGGNAKIAAGLIIASIAGLELAVREHVTGFRSHTTLLSGAVGILVIVGLGLVARLETLGFLVLAGLAAFAGSFVALRELFRRRSGGLSFR